MVLAGFPSPCGEKVGINSSKLTSPKHPGFFLGFPSPCGEKVGINPRASESSVGEFVENVSVPLRGKGRDQRREHRSVGETLRGGFPSPCGEKVGINQVGLPINQN